MRVGRVGPPGQKPAGAFTLIELLIVVAIISILAAIAVPNFLEAQTRAKVSRVKNDARALTTAVESYHVDNNRYPPRAKYPLGSGQLGLADLNTRLEDMRALTTPISYITSLPVDIFEQRVESNRRVLDYYSADLVTHIAGTVRGQVTGAQTSEFGWAIVSVGPDGVLGQTGQQGNYPVRSTYTHFNQEYDPTNGTISVGNITRFQKNGATATNAFRNP